MNKNNKSKDVSKKMAEFLKAGNIMLDVSCPDCKVPLFKLRDGKIICPSCNKIAIYVKHGEEGIIKHYQTIESAFNVVINKIYELSLSMFNEYNETKLKEKVSLMNELLIAYERLSKLKKT